MNSSFEASAENGDYDDEFDEYEIIDDCDQTHNGEDEEESPEEKVVAENLEPQISSQNLLPTEPVIVEGDYKNRMKEIVDRTGYKHEKSSGQHKYGGPPPNFTGPAPGPGQEVYVGKLPPDVLEDELIPMFEKCGTIYELRLMMKPQSSENKGFAFVTFMDKESAKKAHELYNDYEIRPKHQMKVNVSIPNTRLYIGNIKKSKSKDDIFEEVSKFVDGLRDVIIYSQPDTPELKNRGFAFLDFDSHKHASEAKKRLSSESFQYFLFNMNCVIEWAEPQEEPSEEEMSKVKVLYVRNLRSNVSQEDVEALFQMYGQLEKVKKIKDFCFVHFVQREDALKALEALNNKTIKDSVMSITLARPPVEQKMKEKKALLPLPVVPGSAMVGAPRVTSPLIRGIPTPHRGRGVPTPHRGRGVARGGHHHNFYDGYEGYQDDYYYDESGFDHQWGYNQPRPAAPMGRARGSMARGPLLSRPSLMRTPNASSLHPPPKPLMGGIPPKSGMPRLKTPFASPSGTVASVGQEASLKRKAHDNIFGVDNPSKQVKSEMTGSYGEQNTMAQNQTVKKESWETLPIAQKPLSQMMMDFGEQWF